MKKYWELAELENEVLLSRPFWILVFKKKLLHFVWGIIYFCTMDDFFRILEKNSSELICTRLYIQLVLCTFNYLLNFLEKNRSTKELFRFINYLLICWQFHKLTYFRGKEIHCSVLYMMNGHEIKADMHAKKVKGNAKHTLLTTQWNVGINVGMQPGQLVLRSVDQKPPHSLQGLW